MATYEDMWNIPQHFRPDIGIYLGKVLLNFKENNLEPPNYVDVKRKLIKKYGNKDAPVITYTWNYSRDGESSEQFIK